MDEAGLIYVCVAEGEGPWVPGDTLEVRPWEEARAIVWRGAHGVKVYPIVWYPTFMRDLIAARFDLLEMAPIMRPVLRRSLPVASSGQASA